MPEVLEMNDQFVEEDAVMPYSSEEDVTTLSSSGVENVKAAHEHELMLIDGVEGVGIGKSRIGDDAIVIYLRDESVRSRIPRTIEGYPVETHYRHY